MIKQHILVELKQFIYTVANHRGIPKNISSPQLVRNSLNLLEDLPAAREVVLEYFSLVFDVSLGNYVQFVSKDSQGNPPEDELINDIQEALESLVTKGPPAWGPLIASWSLELVGRLSDKYWPSRKLDIGAACNLWLNCSAMRCLLGLMASCFRRMSNTEAEVCIATLLATFRKYSPSFDWVVARLGGCFPLKIISQILQCGLKRFSEDYRCRFDSEIGILDYLSFAHEKDLKHAIKELFDDGFNPKKPIHYDIIPYLMQLASVSEIILQPIVSVFLELYNPALLEVIVRQTNAWTKSFIFRDMTPSLNNIALKVKTNGTKLLLTVSKVADRFFWCQDFIEYTLQELERLILDNFSCPLLNDIAKEESKVLLWKSCSSGNAIEQQTAVRLLLLVSTQHHHIYHQTIAELLMKSYETNKSGIGALIRFVGGLSGTTDFPEVKPGIEMSLERLLLQNQFHFVDYQTECLNAIKNLTTVCKLEKSKSSPYLRQQTVTTSLNTSLSKLLNILECVLKMPEPEGESPSPSIKSALDKRVKTENMEVDPEPYSPDVSRQIVHSVIQLLDVIEPGSGQNQQNMVDILKLAHLTVKYFFWCLTEKSPTLRLTSIDTALTLLRRQCTNSGKAARTICLQDLVEGALFTYSKLFGGIVDDDSNEDDEVGISENEKLIVLNQKQDAGPMANRSVLHAGLIGKGLKSEPTDPVIEKPDAELQAHLLKAIDACCQYSTDRGSTADGYSVVSLLLVEMVSPDIMYNGLPFPDEEFSKVTMERDLQIRRAFKTSPILLPIISLVAMHRPALCYSSVLLRALCASFLHQWRAKNVNRFQSPDENDELMVSTKNLLQILAMGQLLPHPLSQIHMIIEYLEAPEIALVLKECVWNYLKDNVPAPAIFRSANGLYWRNPSLLKPPPQYVDTLRDIMQKKLPKVGAHYYQMFVMPVFEEKEQNSRKGKAGEQPSF
ncbi:unnamed protein product [Hermetia illucens]|uniref:Integrator complex subunit 5 n=1 Tax=Hermetia illucens TaxID=343691 RepID=A0A7R8UMR3_HERIL|nr:integrator complex subunit 5 isoform X1 [Hermetia illucens]CAD7083690.1 unnamed protein product [Hermetia illucens]